MVRGLKSRMRIAYAVLLPLGALGVGRTVINQLAIKRAVGEQLNPQYELQRLGSKLSSAISAQHATVMHCFDSEPVQIAWDAYHAASKQIFAIIEQIFAACPNAQEIGLITDAKRTYEEFENEATRLFSAKNYAALKTTALSNLNEHAQRLRDTLLDLSASQSQRAGKTGEELGSVARTSALLLIVLTIAFVSLGVYFLVDHDRHVVRPIVKVKEAALRMAGGDLSQRLEIESEDEIGQLAFAFNRMSAALRKLTEDLENAARSATRDLHHSEEKYKSLLQRAQEGIIICDQNGFVLEVNRQARKLLGLVESQIYGQSLETVLPAEGARVGAALRLAHRTGRRLRFLIDVPGSGGATQSYEVSIGPVDLGEGRVVLLFLRDVTRQRKIEDQLVRAQRMKSVATLAGGLAHDYNNLLSPILGYASYLRTLPAPSPEFADKLRTIEEAARRAADLSQKLQSLARPRGPSYTGARQPVDLNEVVQFAAKLITPNLNPGVTTVLDVAPEPLLVLSEATELQQIVLNLAINANDAMPSGGQLKFTTRREARSTGDLAAWSP
ncbi:MAG: HAMP domain-containing protein [Planctomycetota bacterium]